MINPFKKLTTKEIYTCYSGTNEISGTQSELNRSYNNRFYNIEDNIRHILETHNRLVDVLSEVIKTEKVKKDKADKKKADKLAKFIKSHKSNKLNK